MEISQLREVLNNANLKYVSGNRIDLIESERTARLKSINIINIAENAIVVHADGFQLNTILKEKKPFSKTCDYLIVVKDTIYFIELKSHENAPEKKKGDVLDKFKTIECIVDLIDSIITRFSKNQFRLTSLNKKFVLFYLNPTLAKTRTSLKKSKPSINNSPERFMGIPVRNNEKIYFGEFE